MNTGCFAVDFPVLVREKRGLPLSNMTLFEGRRDGAGGQEAKPANLCGDGWKCGKEGKTKTKASTAVALGRAECGQALAKLGSGFAVAEQAEGAEVVEVALAAAFGDGADMVSIPKGAAGGDGLHAVEPQTGDAGRTFGPFEGVIRGDSVDAAGRAMALVAGKDLVAKIAGVGAEPPLVDAIVATEGAAAFDEDLKVAPAAQGKPVGTKGERLGVDAAAGKGASGVDSLHGSVFSLG
jgi:hypothetical protein